MRGYELELPQPKKGEPESTRQLHVTDNNHDSILPKPQYQGTKNRDLGLLLDLSHPLNATMQKVQQNAKHVIATVTLRNIIISIHLSVRRYYGQENRIPSRPFRIAAMVTSSVLNMNIRPPHARKKLPSASVGGREGRIERGGPSQTKK